MKKYKIIIIFAISLNLHYQTVVAQSKCLEEVIYETSNLGDGKESLPFPLTFQFLKDSLKVFPPTQKGQQPNNFMSFKILIKKCEWIKKITEGKSEYELLLTDNNIVKHARLNIVIENGKGRITLLYNGTVEPRVFEIKF